MIENMFSKHRKLINIATKANICHKSSLPKQNVYHWPYEKIPYNLLTMWWDPFTMKKFNENSFIIQIEGNIASGKEKFGKQLAEELGLKFMGQPDLNTAYINPYGFDHRSLNPQLPERLRVCDLKMFHENPSRHSVVHFQHYMFVLRVRQYIQALAHFFNTGQGVILERSVFTEKVFVDAMHELGWLPLGHLRADGMEFYDWRKRYDLIRNLICTIFLKPHLTIYLDVSPEECMKRLEQSTDPVIQNSKAIVPEFIQAINDAYENDQLARAQHYGHVLRYDNTKPSQDIINDVIYDMGKLDFKDDPYKSQFKDWDWSVKFFANSARRSITTSNFIEMLYIISQPYYDIAGLGDSITHSDMNLRAALHEHHVVGYKSKLQQDLSQVNIFKALTYTSGIQEEIDHRLFCKDFP